MDKNVNMRVDGAFHQQGLLSAIYFGKSISQA